LSLHISPIAISLIIVFIIIASKNEKKETGFWILADMDIELNPGTIYLTGWV